MTRTRWLCVSVGLALLSLVVSSCSGTSTRAARNPTQSAVANAYGLDSSSVLTRIGLGSCLHQDRSKEVLGTVVEENFDLFLFLGDNVYGDVDTPADMSPLEEAYAKQANAPELQRLLETTPTLAIWDDHDYGLNDAGADFEGRFAAEEIFEDFWNISPEAPQSSWPGTYDAVLIGPPGRRVQILLLDTRFFRSPLRPTDEPRAVGKERYLPDPDPEKTMLGDAQWRWLENQLKEPADLRLLVSSIQILADGHGWEAWRMLPTERDRLYELLERTNANDVLLLSGDRHRAGIYRAERGLSFPLFELTSSSLNLPIDGSEEEPGPNRLGPSYREANFGSIVIDWAAQQLLMRIHDKEGAVVLEEPMPFG